MQQPHSHIQPVGGVSAGTLRLLDLFRTAELVLLQWVQTRTAIRVSGAPGLHSVWRNQNQPTGNLSLMLEQHHQRELTRLGGVKGRGLWAGPLPLRSFEGAQSEWSRRCCDLL